jgi:hypothetical protein
LRWGGHNHCSTSRDIETCSGGGGGTGGAGFGDANIGGDDSGYHTTYNTETGDLVSRSGTGGGGSSVGGGSMGFNCSLNIDGDGECVGGGSPEEDSD